MSRSANIVRINECYAKRKSIESDWNENIGDVKALYPDLETYEIALKTEYDLLFGILADESPTQMHADSSNQGASIVANKGIKSVIK